MTTQAPKPGIYRNISDETYFGWQGAASQSTLKIVKNLTPQHAREDQLNPRDSSVYQSLGTAMHFALIQPELLESRVACGLTLDRRSIANKTAHAEFAEANAGKIILKPMEFDLVFTAAEAIKKHDLAMELLGMQEKELAMTWEDEDTGILCKGRLDVFGQYRQWSAIADVKTTSGSMSDSEIERDVGKWGYDVQAAFYTDGLNTLSPRDRRFFLIFVSSKAPFYIRVFEPNATCMFEGRHKYKVAIKRWAKCLKTGIYPGFPQTITQVGLKPWDQVAERETDLGEE